jgi:hypothetical protein
MVGVLSDKQQFADLTLIVNLNVWFHVPSKSGLLL